MNIGVFFFVLFFLIFSTGQPSSAAGKAKNPTQKATKSSQETVTTSYIKNRNSIRVSFSQLGNVKKISYQLLYQGNGIGQGVMGSVVPKGAKPISKDVYLGTCSSNVCTKHKNIKNAKLQVTIEYKKGKPVTKTYKIKT